MEQRQKKRSIEEKDESGEALYIIPEQWDSNKIIKLEPNVCVEEEPQMTLNPNDFIDIGPVKIEEDMINETLEMDSEESQQRLQQPINKLLSKLKQKERSRLWREELKKNPLKLMEYRARENDRKQKYRKRLMQLTETNNDLLKEIREKDRIRHRIKREREKTESQLAEFCAKYNCNKTLEEEILKVEKALPMDLNKKVKILDILYKKYVEPTNDPLRAALFTLNEDIEAANDNFRTNFPTIIGESVTTTNDMLGINFATFQEESGN